MTTTHYTGPLALNTDRERPALYGETGELIAESRSHRLPEARRLLLCWNACDGFDTDTLELMAAMGETMLSRFQARDGVDQTLITQRLAALQKLEAQRATLDRVISDLNVMRMALMASGVPARVLPTVPRRPPAPPPQHCDGRQLKCNWVSDPNGSGTICLTCDGSIPF